MSTLRLRDPSLSLLLWSGIGERNWYLHSYTKKVKHQSHSPSGSKPCSGQSFVFEWDSKICYQAFFFPNSNIPQSWRIRNLVLESSSILSDFCLDHPFSWVPRDVNTIAHALASWSLTCNLVGSFDLGCCPSAFYEALFFSVSINFLRSLNSFFCNLLFPLIF